MSTVNKEVTTWESQENIELVKALCKTQNLTDDEFRLYCFVCKERGLNPLLGHIYAIKRAGKMQIQLGIDGYRTLADRTGRFMPGKATTYKYDEKGKLVSATSYIKKRIGNEWHEISHEAFFDEYVVLYNGKPGGMWQKMPHSQLGKCAESGNIRKAFSAEISGIYTTEEMEQADSDKVVSIDSQVETFNSEAVIEPIEEHGAMTDEKLKELRDFLSASNTSSEKLEECLRELAKKKGVSFYDVIVSALQSPQLFLPHYKKWIEPSVFE